jgi:hypothetical protein
MSRKNLRPELKQRWTPLEIRWEEVTTSFSSVCHDLTRVSSKIDTLLTPPKRHLIRMTGTVVQSLLGQTFLLRFFAGHLSKICNLWGTRHQRSVPVPPKPPQAIRASSGSKAPPERARRQLLILSPRIVGSTTYLGRASSARVTMQSAATPVSSSRPLPTS